ncbi:unnamed protein product [Absidia cylindrospora]
MQWRALSSSRNTLPTSCQTVYTILLFDRTATTTSSSSRYHDLDFIRYICLSNLHWHELSPPERTLRLGSGPFKAGGLGYLFQQRQELSIYYTNSSDPDSAVTTVPPWETTHDHVLNGPISHVSSLGHGYDGVVDNNSLAAGLQFGVLYHILDDDRIQHWVRVFYFANTVDGDHSLLTRELEFKDILLPGSTWISTFSLESNALLYSRDPDYYRFRWVSLPDDITSSPHSEKADPIILTQSDPGDNTHLYNQPDDIEEYRVLLSAMYSPIPDSKQVFTMNAYKTYSNFYVKGIIAENATTEVKNEWIGKKMLDDDYEVFSQESMEYMAIVDGVPIQQERIQLDMPKLCISRSKDAKVVVMSSIKYPLISLAYMEDASDLVIQQKDINDMVHDGGKIWINDTVGMDDMDGELLGLQLDSTGHCLAAWTDKDQLFLFTRQLTNQQPQHQHFQTFEEDQERDILLDEGRLERWILSMVITKDQGALVDSIDAVSFVTTNSGNYILVGLKNGVVQSYSLDKTEIQKTINFWSFVVDQWNIWLPMSIVIFLFVVSENQQASRLENIQRTS